MLSQFGYLWSNWSYDTLGGTRRQLADLATGSLRDQLLGDAREAADPTLQSQSAVSEATVEAVVLRPREPALIVLNERTELGPSDVQSGYQVYLGTATRTSDGWKVTSWRPV